MLTVQNYRLTPNRVSFKSNNEENAEQPKPFQTHAGLKTGAVWSCIGTAYSLAVNGIASKIETVGKTTVKDLEKDLGSSYIKGFKNELKQLGMAKNALKITLPVHILAALGSGALVDKLINDKHVQLADTLNEEGKKAALEDDNTEITKKENVYYKSNIGKKLGPVLGAVIIPAVNLISSTIARFKLRAGNYATGAVIGAAGGLILGAIADKAANKGAAKYADKQNVEA